MGLVDMKQWDTKGVKSVLVTFEIKGTVVTI